MQFSTILSIAFAALVSAAPAEDVTARGDSGCFAFEDPDCGIDYAVCQCANGWFYQYNRSEPGCNPPWGFLAKSERGLKGFRC